MGNESKALKLGSLNRTHISVAGLGHHRVQADDKDKVGVTTQQETQRPPNRPVP